VCLDRPDNGSRFAGFDVDERAVERIAVLAHILAARGFGGAFIATNGSRDGKGKLALFFRRSQPGAALRKLTASVLEDARKHPSWGIERPETIETRPQHKDQEGSYALAAATRSATGRSNDSRIR
jgi:hypothetical protein